MKIPIAVIIIAAVAVVGAGAFYILTAGQNEKEVHEHADFMVYINNEPFNFSQERYMTHENSVLSNFIHMHDGNGKVIHKHALGIDMGFFFRSLSMRFNSTCLTLDDGRQFCNDGTRNLRMFVNGKENLDFNKYEPNDLDRILIAYGATEEELRQQMDSVGSEACIYSGKCPEKGEPPGEGSCSTGGGKCIPEPLKNFEG